MKKLLITSSLIFAIAASAASAKDNLYVGLNGIMSDSKADIDGVLKLNKKSLGLGANVGYKLTTNGLIVAPEAFFDYLNNKKILPVSDEGDNFKIKNKFNYRYGARLNIGYEINNQFSVVANYGLAAVDYEISTYDDVETFVKKRGSKISSIYGLGAGYNLNENITLKLNANLQNFDYKIEESKVKNKIMTYSAGVAYNF